MTQTVIAVFDSPTAAQSAEAALSRQGIEKSSLQRTAKGSAQGGGSQKGESMEGIRSFLSELFGPEGEDEAENYVQAIDHGGILLSVDVPDGVDIQQVRQAMHNAGAVDLEKRIAEWRDEEEGSQSAGEKGAARGKSQSRTMPVIEEEMEIGKRQSSQGTVRVTSRMVETPFSEDVTLKDERATVERRPVDRPVTPDEIAAMGKEETIEVEEMSERSVVSKSARVVEEVEVGKETSERTETVEDTLRRTEIDVERESGEDTEGKGGKGSKHKSGKR